MHLATIGSPVNRTDKNQDEIVKYLRSKGVSVFIASQVGKGFPDLVIGFGGITVLVEIKSGSYGLSENQKEFFNTFDGMKCVIRNKEDCDDLISLMQVFSVVLSKVLKMENKNEHKL